MIEGVIAIYPEKLRSWETSITFLACVFGFVLGLPFVTQVCFSPVDEEWWCFVGSLFLLTCLLSNLGGSVCRSFYGRLCRIRVVDHAHLFGPSVCSASDSR